jgi:alkylated DNA repair dioxygenase AlkB
VKARALIQKRVQQALEKHIEFNEILSAAYMERQKMAFHSDNEIGLGPVVAGLSLGSPALMHFRINAKYDRLRELKGNLLSFVLRHGDILVMDGSSVQEYYDYTKQF